MNNFDFKYYIILVFTCVFYQVNSQTLIINEVSNGASGNKEYVELLVVGTPTCNSIPTMDLRGYYIDDNNGWHETIPPVGTSDAGKGVANGCIRFANNTFWSNIPIGTIILIYNDADLNANVPAQDISIADGNCKLVIPISNCTFFEKNITAPSVQTALVAANTIYPTTGFSACGNWSQISMANGDDSFQVIDPSGNLVFSVSWGNNSVSPIIYFAAAQGGMVSYMSNSVNNVFTNQANWVNVAVALGETPGAPNNAANAAWINSMNNSCTALLPLTLTITANNAGCICDGSATVTATGAIAPYTYSWSPSGGTSASASGLCAGNYTATVTSFNGCVQTSTVAISAAPSASVIVNSQTVCVGSAAILTATPSTLGGTYLWSLGGQTTTSISVNPGSTTTYSVTYTLAGCGAINNGTVSVTPLPSITVNSTTMCLGQTATLTANGAGTYTWSTGSSSNPLLVSPVSNTNYTVTGTALG